MKEQPSELVEFFLDSYDAIALSDDGRAILRNRLFEVLNATSDASGMASYSMALRQFTIRRK